WHCRIVACEGEFMPKSLSVLAAISVFGASAAIADPCPPHRPGASYPWDVPGVMSGDQWAELAVNVDTKGKVTDCKIASGNLENEMGFWVCRSILAQGEFDPQI